MRQSELEKLERRLRSAAGRFRALNIPGKLPRVYRPFIFAWTDELDELGPISAPTEERLHEKQFFSDVRNIGAWVVLVLRGAGLLHSIGQEAAERSCDAKVFRSMLSEGALEPRRTAGADLLGIRIEVEKPCFKRRPETYEDFDIFHNLVVTFAEKEIGPAPSLPELTLLPQPHLVDEGHAAFHSKQLDHYAAACEMIAELCQGVAKKHAEEQAGGSCQPETSKVQNGAAPDLPAVSEVDWLRVSNAARKTGIPDSTLSKACAEGRLRCNGKRGPERRIDPNALEEFKATYKPRPR